jgi:hypothetical protein
MANVREALLHAPELDNYYTRMLLGKKGYTAETLEKKHFAEASSRLLHIFHIIAVLEDKRCLSVLLNAGLKKLNTSTISLSHMNRNTEDITKRNTSISELKMDVESLNIFDKKLYELASLYAKVDCYLLQSG